MVQPKQGQVRTGAQVLSAPQSAGGPGVTAKFGDVVTHASGTGWHVCIATFGASVVVPVGGLQAGHSDDQFRWSQGASYSGQGVPQSYSPPTYDAAQTGIGTDGRINGGNTGTPSF